MSHQGPDEANLRCTVLLSAHRALWGKITPNTRGVSCRWSAKAIELTFFYASSHSTSEWDDAELAATEVMADFPDHVTVTSNCVVSRPPAKLMPPTDSWWLYLRKED